MKFYTLFKEILEDYWHSFFFRVREGRKERFFNYRFVDLIEISFHYFTVKLFVIVIDFCRIFYSLGEESMSYRSFLGGLLLLATKFMAIHIRWADHDVAFGWNNFICGASFVRSETDGSSYCKGDLRTTVVFVLLDLHLRSLGFFFFRLTGSLCAKI